MPVSITRKDPDPRLLRTRFRVIQWIWRLKTWVVDATGHRVRE